MSSPWQPDLTTSGGGDTFLALDGIVGESTDDHHRGAIDIQSWFWGVSSTDTQVVGRPKFTDLTFTTSTSRASPALMLACAQGRHLRQAVVTVRQAGEDRRELLKITLTDVAVTSFQQAGAGGRPAEQFALAYAQLVLEYRLQQPDGSPGEVIRSGWDLKRNRPL